MGLLSKPDVCARLSISLATLNRLLERGELPAVRIGRRVLFDAAAIEAWIASKSR